MKQKTIKPKFFDKLKVGAAAFALALPLCAGCVKKDTVKPVQQPAAAMSQPASAPKRMATAMGIVRMEMNPRIRDNVDRAVSEAYRKAGNKKGIVALEAAMSQPDLHEAAKKQPDKSFASSRWVTAGMKLATKDYVITVLELTNYGVILLAESPGHQIMFQVPYGQKFIDAPEVGVFRAEKGGQPNTAKLEIE